MERVTISDGTSWPNPNGDEYGNLAWRLTHHNSVTRQDLLCAASVMEAYGYLIAEPTLSMKRAIEKIKGIRSAIG